MAQWQVVPIFNALRRVTARDLPSLFSLKLNNFFLFIWLLIYSALESGIEPKSAEPLLMIAGLLLLFPASTDPLAKSPPSRRGIWPVPPAQWIALRLASLLLSPITWIATVLLIKISGPAALSFAALALAAQFISFGAGSLNPLRWIPQFPGRLGGLIRNNLRQLLSLLDPYLALIFALSGAWYCFLYPHPDPAAPALIAVLIALALSTYTQSLFALDGPSGLTRYALLPLRNWEILLAKDLSFLLILVALTIPFHLAAGLTFGLWSLTLGHYSSRDANIPQKRWRFATGRLLPAGALQSIGGFALAFGERAQPVILPIVIGLWLLSFSLP